MRKTYRTLYVNVKGNLKDLVLDDREILKLILKKRDECLEWIH